MMPNDWRGTASAGDCHERLTQLTEGPTFEINDTSRRAGHLDSRYLVRRRHPTRQTAVGADQSLAADRSHQIGIEISCNLAQRLAAIVV